jgi:hypothetical protein
MSTAMPNRVCIVGEFAFDPVPRVHRPGSEPLPIPIVAGMMEIDAS